MSRPIEIDEDVYEFLREKCSFRETESIVLRRLLNLPKGKPTEVPEVTTRKTMEDYKAEIRAEFQRKLAGTGPSPAPGPDG